MGTRFAKVNEDDMAHRPDNKIDVLQSRQDVVDRIRHHFFVAHVTSLVRPGRHHDRRRNQHPHSISFFKDRAAPLARQQCKRVVDHRTEHP